MLWVQFQPWYRFGGDFVVSILSLSLEKWICSCTAAWTPCILSKRQCPRQNKYNGDGGGNFVKAPKKGNVLSFYRRGICKRLLRMQNRTTRGCEEKKLGGTNRQFKMLRKLSTPIEYQVHKLLSCFCTLPKPAQHTASRRHGSRFFNSSHNHTQVLTFHHDCYPLWS